MLPTLVVVTAGVWPLSDVIVRRQRARRYAPAMVDERLALDRRRCDRARVARDARYDGRFFSGVLTVAVAPRGSETGRCLSVAGYVAATGPRSGGNLVLAILGPGPSLAQGCSSSRCAWAIPEGGRPGGIDG